MAFTKSAAVTCSLWLIFCTVYVKGYGSGAPPTVCSSMIPNHGLDAQDSESPYALGISKAKETSGDVVVVTILSPETQQFQGFFLQARDANDKMRIVPGSFSTPPQTQHVGCNGSSENSLTHVSTSEKGNITTVWTPPPNFNGQVVFRATVAKTFDVYWIDLETVPMPLKSGASTTNVKTQPKGDVVSNQIPEKFVKYEVCGQTKGCFGMPTMCVEKRNCAVLLMYTPKSDGVEFEMTAGLDNGSHYWISVGISEDKYMGGDSVTECYTNDGGTPKLRQSWNEANGRKTNRALKESRSGGISNDNAAYVEGYLTCKWKRQLLTSVEGVTFNLKENNYYLLLAKGPIKRDSPDSEKLKHKFHLQSQNPVNLTRIELVAGKPNYLVKIHGAFMVVAWIGLVSIAILLARHYKIVWEDRTICGAKVWFFSHRSMMLLAVGMIIAAFVVIFLHVDGWSQVGPNPHPILGCVCTGLAVIQPFMATFRPKPNSSNRYIFNWLHWLVGNAAQIIAIVTMYFAVELSAVSLNIGFICVLSAFVAFHFFFHIIMQIHTYHMEKKVHPEIQMRDFGEKSAEFSKDAPGSGFRRFMLGIYIAVNVGLVTALVLMVCLQ